MRAEQGVYDLAEGDPRIADVWAALALVLMALPRVARVGFFGGSTLSDIQASQQAWVRILTLAIAVLSAGRLWMAFVLCFFLAYGFCFSAVCFCGICFLLP